MAPPTSQEKPSKKTRKSGEAKRELIYTTALGLFRVKGFEETTMRDIAKAAGISVGSAYHYFDSKEAIVFDYYDSQRIELEATARTELPKLTDLRERLGVLIHRKLDLLKNDRAFAPALARSVPDPKDPLSVFSTASRPFRLAAVAVFDEALNVPGIAKEHRPLLAEAMWSFLMLSLAFYSWDDSPGAKKTRRLVDGVLDILVPFLPLTGMPMLAPLFARVAALLSELDLPLYGSQKESCPDEGSSSAPR